MIGAGMAAQGGFKLGKALWGAGKRFVANRVAKAQAEGFNLSSGGANLSVAGNAPTPKVRAGAPGSAPEAPMDYMKYAPYAVGALLLLMMKK